MTPVDRTNRKTAIVRIAALALLTFGVVDFLAATTLHKSVVPGDGLPAMIATLVGLVLLVRNPRKHVTPRDS